MYLEILTLALLLNEPLHAYSIRSKINQIFVDYRQINNNTLYPLMKKLEAEAYITKSLIIQTDKPNKAIYTITEKGKNHLLDLLKKFSPKDANNEMEFYTRVMLFNLLDKNTIRTILNLRKEILLKRQNFYSKNGTQDLFPSINHKDMFKHLSDILKNETDYIHFLEEKYLK